MKKVGIITFHHAKHSYGAALQAYATLSVVKELGYDVEIIDYENKYEQKEIKFQKGSIKMNLFLFLNWCGRIFLFGGIKDPARDKKKLDIFYESVSSKSYKSKSELINADYDILISGSDQIWNPEVTNGIDSTFFLDFGNPQKKIAYASSIGSYRFTDDEKLYLSTFLNQFNEIGVREQYAIDELQKYINHKMEVVCDPTLLITGNEWKKIFKKEISKIKGKSQYILTYFVGGNINDYWSRIEKFVDKVGLPIYNIQSHTKRYTHVDKVINNILPSELVAYIENASLILTDSFHGTAFSINLNKSFIAVLNKSNPVRVQNLLKEVGLETRIDELINEKAEQIQYDQVNEKLDLFRAHSLAWLINALK